MAINQRTPSSINQTIKQFPGPYVGYVKNSTDLNRMGRLFVFIPSLHGTYDETNKNPESQLIPVSYCSPFAGQTPLSETNSVIEFANTQKSYGFWMIPPDIDTKVLVMFADGDINSGYWIGCVYEDYMNHMTPGIAVSQPNKFVGTSAENEEYYVTRGLTQVPVAENQRKAESVNIARINSDPRKDNAYSVRPAHTPSTQTLINQGLITDPVRGTTTSSARRETPSQVFGISTPGPIDFTGQTTKKKSAITRHGKIYNDVTDEFAFDKVAHSRLGGNTFVMDDGTPVKREGSVNKTEIENELIRLRTRSGAQVLLHNSKDVVYIINNSGTAWIEFTQDGKIDVYAKDSVSIHTEADMNFRADRDINLEAGRNINIKATGQYDLTPSTTGRVHIDAFANIEMIAGSNINQKAGGDYKLYAVNGKIEVQTNIDFYAGTDFLANTGNEIHMNTSGKVSQGHVPNTVVESLSIFNKAIPTEPFTRRGTRGNGTIMKRVPLAEPYVEHEDKVKDETTSDKTDRENTVTELN